jgi:hypothetical protein
MTDLWTAPDACTLPSVARPLRVAEFDALFGSSLVRLDRLDSTKVRMILTGTSDLADRVQDLADRETACCSFFTFSVQASPSDHDGATSVQLDIEVLPGFVDVLAALSDQAESQRTGAL